MTDYMTISARQNFYQNLLDRIRSEPGVQGAAISLELPLEGSRGEAVKLTGEPASQPTHAISWNVVTEDYFQVMRIPLLAGRTFTAFDMERTGEGMVHLRAAQESNRNSTGTFTYPIVVNQKLARTLFPEENALGKLIIMGSQIGEIVGVVGDVKQEDIRQPAQPEAFGPLPAELMNHWYPAAVSIRSSTPPGSVVAGARHSLAQLDPSLSFFNIRTMEEVIAENMEDASLQTAVLSAFAGMALLLAAVGLYGVMAYAVAQRTREIGIRMALGAHPRAVMAMVLGRGGRLTLAGLVLGAPAAFGLARLLSKMLFAVGVADPVTFAAVASLLAAVAMAACYIPARRAMQVDPVVALRYE
jgi:putative ABC transport system permease protein